METTNQKAIDVLNDLLETNNDRIDGYGHASRETDEDDLKTMFTQFAGTSHKCKQELISEIQKLGGEPTKGTSTSGKIYRAWMDVKAAITNKDRGAILNSCEFGEDVALKKYEDALQNENTQPSHVSMITSQLGLIRAEHNRIKDLRDVTVNL